MNSPKKLILFRKKIIRISKEPTISQVGGISFFNLAELANAIKAKEDGGEYSEETVETKTILEYVTMVDSVSEIAKIIRKSPLEQYILFEGDMHKVSVPMQVLIDGRPADTLEAEWRTDGEIEIPDEVRNLQIDEDDADLEIPPSV